MTEKIRERITGAAQTAYEIDAGGCNIGFPQTGKRRSALEGLLAWDALVRHSGWFEALPEMGRDEVLLWFDTWGACQRFEAEVSK